MSTRTHPSDQEHKLERHALSIALLHGPAILANHGLRYHHFSKDHANLFHLLEVAARETPTGIPESVRVLALASNEADSGIPANELPLVMASLLEGTGEGHNAAWYAGKIIAGWKRRESILLSILLQKIQSGEAEGDLQKITAKLRNGV